MPRAAGERPRGRPRSVPRPSPFPADQQSGKFAPRFARLAEVLARDASGFELRSDPAALAPERLLVFELRGTVSAFAVAIRKVPGLELIDEEELDADDGDKQPAIYLLVPDARALRELESLWQRWVAGTLAHGESAWRDVFSLLRDLRPWGPQDRVLPDEAEILSDEIAARGEGESLHLEVELVYRADPSRAARSAREVRDFITGQGGRVISESRIEAIAYHAFLVTLPVSAVREVIERSPASVAGLDAVMHIRPQAIASAVEIVDATAAEPVRSHDPLGDPILALLDGVPIAAHRLLADHLIVNDRFDLEPSTAVPDRVHGTAMASLIVHGDRNRAEPPLPRKIHAVPVLGAQDRFPDDRLIVDLIYTAVYDIRGTDDPKAPGVLIVNLSLGNPRRPFHRHLSPWARLLDKLAYDFGLLFIVSSGNHKAPFPIKAFERHTAYEDASPTERATETLRALAELIPDRRLFSPAETVNGITVGAANEDAVQAAHRIRARTNVDPYAELRMANPSSALGPGFATSVKPDVLLPGAREHLRLSSTSAHIEVQPCSASRAAGLRAAAPLSLGMENAEGYTSGTSAAAALASRTAHRIHDALEATYGEDFLGLSHLERAVVLKALLVHPAKWPDTTASLIRSVLGPKSGRHHVRQKDNIRRFLGFGIVDADEAVACAGDRATFWATGTLQRDRVATVSVPVPGAISGKARPHSLTVTLGWFTPTLPGRQSYRAVRLKIIEPETLGSLAVQAHRNQPDSNQSRRGTVFTRCWSGDRAPLVGPNMTIDLTVQRDPDQGIPIDDDIPFGLAVTLTMPGEVEIYEQARAALGLTIAPRTRV